MIIDAKAIVLTLGIIAVAFYVGLKFIRQFALQIALENHDAIAAMDQKEEQERQKKARAADAAASAAFAKVENTLPKNGPSSSQPKSSKVAEV
eukprot:Nitzschia sp. Nitz4//scaffold4_size323378//228851//229129//NITZ4_000689-RA/size323378-processed-gene-0.372-mRNA-1//-1//CDS//3329553486//1017//frame0